MCGHRTHVPVDPLSAALHQAGVFVAMIVSGMAFQVEMKALTFLTPTIVRLPAFLRVCLPACLPALCDCLIVGGQRISTSRFAYPMSQIARRVQMDDLGYDKSALGGIGSALLIGYAASKFIVSPMGDVMDSKSASLLCLCGV